MTDGDDVFSFEEFLNPEKRRKMVEEARNEPAKAQKLQDFVAPCHICKKIKALHDTVDKWDGHPWCKDNLAFLRWKFESKKK